MVNFLLVYWNYHEFGYHNVNSLYYGNMDFVIILMIHGFWVFLGGSRKGTSNQVSTKEAALL